MDNTQKMFDFTQNIKAMPKKEFNIHLNKILSGICVSIGVSVNK